MDSYFDPSHAGSFGGVQTFKRHVDGSIKGKDVKIWLQNKDTYTLHKPVRLKFRRRRAFTVGIDDLWQADLADVSFLSKHAWVVPLKSKTGAALTAAFSSMLHDRHPVHLQTDKGTEFLNKQFQSMLRKNDIRFYTTENSDTKASVVERFNQPFK